MKYISILRGINVSGKKKIKMTDLKALYEAEGFTEVTTYIQSGNVIFDSGKQDRMKLITIIEKAIEKKYQFHVPVDLRTHQELESVINQCPFEEAKQEENGTKILVTFLKKSPSKENIKDLLEKVKSPEQLQVSNNNVYLYCPNGYGKSKLTNNLIEKKLKTSATTRNWKSIKKLHELSL